MASAVTAIPAAAPEDAEARFAALFAYETDCWDVHEALGAGPDFVLLDVRSPAKFEAAMCPARSICPMAASLRQNSRNGLRRRCS